MGYRNRKRKIYFNDRHGIGFIDNYFPEDYFINVKNLVYQLEKNLNDTFFIHQAVFINKSLQILSDIM